MITAPNSFVCSVTKRVMQRPYLGDCAHLFDVSVLNVGNRCPMDGMPLDHEHCLELPQLAARIEKWRQTQQAPSAPTFADKIKTAKSSKRSFQPVEIIANAHSDDIHGLMKITSRIFVSGSKDTTVVKWDRDQQNKETLSTNYPTKGYQSWITALGKINNDKFASATRDGFITIWSMDCKVLRTSTYKPSWKTKDETIAKDRNKGRINCISANIFGNPETFFTGSPKYVQLWSSKTGKMEQHWEADANDWVYCIEPLSPDSLLTVIGSRLEHWSQLYQKNHHVDCIFSLPKIKDGPRPFISSILRLETQRNLIPCAIFDGSVQVVNLDTKQVVQKFQEHQKRVWTVIELAPQLIASCADDSLIKIWDLRQRISQLTLGGNPGRVSCLLKLDEDEFVSASCPDKVFESTEKAQLSFWDMRKINAPLQSGDL